MTDETTPETTPDETQAPEAAPEVAAEETAVAVAEAPAPKADEPATELSQLPAQNVTPHNPIWAVGRRKSATARCRMFPGGGNVIVNGRALDEYFNRLDHQRTCIAPLMRTNVEKDVDVRLNVRGGGITGQAGAIRMAVARALTRLRPDLESSLRDAGYLTRDARVSERKKYGRRGARRGFQFSKR